MQMKMDGRTALVTGGSMGLGRAMGAAFAGAVVAARRRVADSRFRDEEPSSVSEVTENDGQISPRLRRLRCPFLRAAALVRPIPPQLAPQTDQYVEPQSEGPARALRSDDWPQQVPALPRADPAGGAAGWRADTDSSCLAVRTGYVSCRPPA